jgi:ribosomal protein S18 acetylase RimI-like enzyme
MSPRLRVAGAADAENIALLHADSWHRHYRGAYADAYLDGDLRTDRLTVWSARLEHPTGTMTVVAEDESGLVGFVHIIFDHDPHWGSLIDNLHVAHHRQRTGLGATLLTHAAHAAAEQASNPALHLWVLEQNTAAQQFYKAMGGTLGQREPTSAPGGVPTRLNGTPHKLRITWPHASTLTRTTGR